MTIEEAIQELENTRIEKQLKRYAVVYLKIAKRHFCGKSNNNFIVSMDKGRYSNFLKFEEFETFNTNNKEA